MRSGSLLFVVLAACGGPREPAPAVVAVVSVAPSASAAPLRVVGPRTHIFNVFSAKTSIDMVAPKEHIRAETTAARGTIAFDAAEPTKAEATIEVDLLSLRTFTFGDADKDTTQTKQAKTWLEAVVGDEVKEPFRWATFTLERVENVVPTHDGVFEADVHGTFEVHGHRVPKDARIEVTQWADVLRVRTLKPFTVRLADHDIKPRDELGKIAKGAFSLLGTKVADEAAITFTLESR